MNRVMARMLGVVGASVMMIGATGCVERRVEITSEPSGATVWLNDQLIGVTPVEAGFKFYGMYDVRLELAGYDPIHEGREMKAPWYEYPGFDLAATAIPANFESLNHWHFEFDDQDSLDRSREAVLDRAMQMRDAAQN